MHWQQQCHCVSLEHTRRLADQIVSLQGGTPSPGINFVSGAAASVAATLITQPAGAACIIQRLHASTAALSACRRGKNSCLSSACAALDAGACSVAASA